MSLSQATERMMCAAAQDSDDENSSSEDDSDEEPVPSFAELVGEEAGRRGAAVRATWTRASARRR